jgi:hypothetical protein
MWKYLIWVVWLVLVVIWLSPEVESVRDKVTEHNEQIKKIINE